MSDRETIEVLRQILGELTWVRNCLETVDERALYKTRYPQVIEYNLVQVCLKKFIVSYTYVCVNRRSFRLGRIVCDNCFINCI